MTGSRARLILAGLLAVAAVLAALAGCSNGTDSTTTSLSPTTVTSASASTTTTDDGAMLTEEDKQLIATSDAQRSFAIYLDSLSTAENDPQQAILRGLKARMQALTCLKTVKQPGADMRVADSAIDDVQVSLSLGGDIATGEVAEALGAAKAIIEPLGKPSADLEAAKNALPKLIEVLTPLMQTVGTEFEEAVGTGSTSYVPYSYLARQMAGDGDFNGALALLDKGIGLTGGEDKSKLETQKEGLLQAINSSTSASSSGS